MLTAREEAFLRDVAINDGQKEKKPFFGTRSGMTYFRSKWPDGVLRYELKNTFSDGQKELVRRILREFAEEISSMFPPVESCITFLETDTGNRVIFEGPQKAKGCHSTIGYKERGLIGLAWVCLNPGTIKHEAMHSLGIFHQHSRSDRDDYVQIMQDNILSNQTGNFKKYPSFFISAHGLPYDLMSVMHYHHKMFSKNGDLTIRTLDENAQYITLWNLQSGRNARLTDIELIRRMYNCEPAEELSENNPSGWVIKFSRAPKMRLKRNHLLTTLPILPTEWKVNFQLSARKKLNPPKKLYSIFHMSNANVDKISAIYTFILTWDSISITTAISKEL